MSNRDYFSRPIQDSRSAHDYGRSNIPFERETYRATTAEAVIAVVAAIIIAIVACIYF